MTSCDRGMADSSKKFEPSLAVNTRGMSDMEAIAEAVLEKQCAFLETRFDKLQQMAEDTDAKLGSIQADLLSLNENIGSVNLELEKIRSDVEGNRGKLAVQETALELQRKLADMEDRSRCCNVRVIGLPEGAEGSNLDQTGFVKSRLASDNVRRLLHIIDAATGKKDPAAVLSLDAMKAFDGLEWSFLWAVLEKKRVLVKALFI